jgi:arylsulfatase
MSEASVAERGGEGVKKPNFLVFLPDQHRGDWMPWRGEAPEDRIPLPLRMPNIRRIMDSGVTFTHAMTPSPLCAPARACLASGLRYHRCRVPDNGVDYPLDQRTYYSVLREAGYSVGGVGKLDLHKPTFWWGLDGWIPALETLGFTHGIDNAGKWDAVCSGADSPKDPYMKYLHDRGLAALHLQDMESRRGSLQNRLRTDPTPLPEEAYCDNWIAENALQMLERFPGDAPWHLVVNFTGPHDPWDITERMHRSWQGIGFPPPVCPDESHVRRDIEVRKNYAAALENIDRNIGRIIDAVERIGGLEDTIVVYASDHGEMLGDFGLYGKSNPHRGSVDIPLVISGPGIPKGRISGALVELQDLTSTIVDAAGCRMPEALDSRSLSALLSGNLKTHRDYSMSALSSRACDWRLIEDRRYKLILESGETPVLYDRYQDPLELHDISSEAPAETERLAAILAGVPS